ISRIFFERTAMNPLFPYRCCAFHKGFFFIEKKDVYKLSKAKEKKLCSKCQKEKFLTRDFYSSYSPLDTDGKLKICKKCVQEMVDIDHLPSLQDMLRMIDKPYIAHLWESALT